MTASIITETFFYLEGQTHQGEVIGLAVGFDKKEMIALATELAETMTEVFAGFSLTEQGNYILRGNAKPATHEAPIRPI